jgi:DNA-binding GntR family transcriptional regulator
LVSRHRGRGTLVSPPKIARWLSIYTFEEDLRQQGIKYETRLIDFQFRCVPPEPIREQLALPAGSPVGFLSLVRVVDGLIICHDRHYLPPMIASRLDPTIVRDRPLVDVLSQITQMRIRSLNWTTEIIPASHDVARALGITPGVLVLANTGTEYLDDASPAQVTVMFYRVDRVKFRFAVDRSK